MLTFKIATKAWEFEQIHSLNYRTFVREIPQHTSSDNVLIDKYHNQNTYIIGLQGTHLAGMLAVRAERPFSLDEKLKELDSFLPTGGTLCELRLLAIAPHLRSGRVLRGLFTTVSDYCTEQGYDTFVISATVRQLKMYLHIGFVPFGPRVGSARAIFQPMYLTIKSLRKSLPWVQEL